MIRPFTPRTCLQLSTLVFMGCVAAGPPPSATVAKPAATPAKAVDAETSTQVAGAYGQLPLSFIQNDGQVDKSVKFYEKGSGHATYFTTDGVYLSLVGPNDNLATECSRRDGVGSCPDGPTASGALSTATVVKLLPLGGNKNPKIVAQGRQEGTVNYIVGKDPKKWKTNVPTYQAVVYQEVYPGIDMKFYGNNRQLEYDLIVKPGADPSKVTLAYEGIAGLRVTDAGDLEIALTDGKLFQKKPIVYQEINGRRVAVDGRFTVPIRLDQSSDRFAYRVQVAAYDPGHPLIIDPVLVYSTYLGGSGEDLAYAIAVDGTGSVYLTGDTGSTDFPLVTPFQGSLAGGGFLGFDSFVMKLNPAGTAIVYSTYLGGSGDDIGYGIDVDATGAAYVVGYTESTDFPTTAAFQPNSAGGPEGFVTKLSPAGTSLIYSTYLGGTDSDFVADIDVNASSQAYLTGGTSSSNFPTTVGSPQPTYGGGAFPLGDAFVSKLSATGTGLIYSTYLGGANDDRGFGIAVASDGIAAVVGWTDSLDFPLYNPVQGVYGGGTNDAFVSRINISGNAVVTSTYLGGSGFERAYTVAVDGTGAVYVTGRTDSTDFPTLNPLQGSYGGGLFDAFVTKFDFGGLSLVYSTYLGGSGEDWGRSLALDGTGSVYLTGFTVSTDFPLVNPIQASLDIPPFPVGYPRNAYVSRFNPAGTALVFSTYLGEGDTAGWGIAVDNAGAAYVTGATFSEVFPTVDPVQSTMNGVSDVFLTKINLGPTPSILGSISTRAFVGTGDQVAVAGFIISGTGAKQILIRGFGPTLSSFGVTGALPNPVLELSQDTDNNPNTPAVLLVSNDDWGTNLTTCPAPVVVCGTPTDIINTGRSAYTYAPTNPNRHLDAALMVTLQPGTYTATLKGVSNATGVSLVTVNDLDVTPTATLLALSTRAFVGTGDNVAVGGLIISGTTPKQVLIRGFGPTLSSFGVAGAMANPVLELSQDDDNNPNTPAVVIVSNDDWGTNLTTCPAPLVACGTVQEISDTGKSANTYAPSNPNRHLDAALLITLPPGTYMATLKGVNLGTGVGLIAVNETEP